MSYNLLTVSGDSKTVKGEQHGYLTGILYLSPASLSGKNLCPHSSPGCRAACLYTSGRARTFPAINKARLRRSELFIKDRESFMIQLMGDIAKLESAARKRGLKPAIRLNGTSDIPFENISVFGKTLFKHFPKIRFYEYSKILKRFLNPNLPKNLHLTFSRSESNSELIPIVTKLGYNVAVVFRKKIPLKWNGMKTINADSHDLRFLDPKGVICALRAKGRAKIDTSGFVVD
jgi:hypothetical protein